MLREERRREIVRLIDAGGRATVADLAQRFGVAEMTIRRDLDDLDAQQLLRRIHGGALRCERPAHAEPPVLERVRQQAGVKRRIALAVAAMVREGEAIFIGSGTTALAVAEALVGRTSLTVVTNALTVAEALACAPSITVAVVGGFLRHSELSLIGHLAEAALRDIKVSKVIMGIAGIDVQHGLSSEHLQELMTDRAILSISDTVIIVADHTKFGHIAASRTAPVTAATIVVTDSEAPADIVAELRSAGIQVVLV
ncbi:MAG TPA: DeoR/GlpR family DNA-binding transcription regulator [Anaerolineae bacterium]|nr:DeoR/GlpR family DNA-binding transcription regulator [Anaerolineae bacterium]HOQ99232.1 DeoR/GlpR family DNA-binding transcription regulator [Anaerolineae bacterium]HPL28065.1 DeoR/GlpR family DNA-binding transcription regulator [Anaerolineae bacterium]